MSATAAAAAGTTTAAVQTAEQKKQIRNWNAETMVDWIRYEFGYGIGGKFTDKSGQNVIDMVGASKSVDEATKALLAIGFDDAKLQSKFIEKIRDKVAADAESK